MNSTPFPRYRDRYLPAMTAAQITALPDRAWAPVILPVGAIEQHGPHLPVAVDSFLAQVWVEQLLPRLPAGASCYIAPPITVGKSNEHTGFPGTLMISKETLRAQLLVVARQVYAWGFGQLAILNTHGGNLAVIGYTMREITATYGLRTGFLQGPPITDISPQEAAYGFHANEVETSLLLATARPLVKMADATCDYCARLGDTRDLRPERAGATFAWVSQDLSRTGVMGDATIATVEKGERWLAQTAEGLAQSVARLCTEARARTKGTAP
jgi:creatinine amidohydrolase